MWFKHRAWAPIAWALSLINLGAVWFAARPGEAWHATIHALLAALFGLGAQHLSARRRAMTGREDLEQVLDQNEQLSEAMDGLQAHIGELEERVDVAERLLAGFRDRDRLDAPPS